MKKTVSLIAVAIVICACTYMPGFVIKGKAGDLDGKAVLVYTLPEEKQVRDTVIMENGRFVFKGSVPEVLKGKLFLLPVGEDPMHASIYLENCSLSILIEPESVVNHAQYGGRILHECQVTGGPNNAFKQVLEESRKAVGQRAEFKEMAAAMEEVERMGYADMAAFRQKQAEIQTKYADQLQAYYEATEMAAKECIAAHPEVEAAASMFHYYSSDLPLDEYEAGFNQFTEKVRNSFFAKEAREEIAARKATQPGAVAPDFTLNDLEGNPVTLSSLRGQYVLVDFWASWCKPCRTGVPAMKELYKKYHTKGFEIIGVSDDDNHDAWKQAVAQDQTPWIHVVDKYPEPNKPSRVGSLYGIHYIPSYFLLDKEGKVIGKMDHDELAAKLAELMP